LGGDTVLILSQGLRELSEGWAFSTNSC